METLKDDKMRWQKRRRKQQPGGKGRAVATRTKTKSDKMVPDTVVPVAASSRGRRSRDKADPTAKQSQSPAPLLKAVRYAAMAPTPRWPAAAYARIGTDCAGLEVVMSVMEDLKIETCHVLTLV